VDHTMNIPDNIVLCWFRKKTLSCYNKHLGVSTMSCDGGYPRFHHNKHTESSRKESFQIVQ